MIKPIIPNWTTKNKTILIKVPSVSLTLYNLPIFININEQSGALNENLKWIFDITNNYKNLAFFAQGEILETEVERWDISSRNAQFWVKLPILKAYEDAYIYLQIDKDKNNDKINEIGSAQNVWNEYFQVVYHFSQNPNYTIKDSTSFQAHLGPNSNLSLIDSENWVGKNIGKCLNFPSADYTLETINSHDFSKLEPHFSFFGLVKFGNLSSNDQYARICQIGPNDNGSLLFCRYNNENTLLNGVIGDSTSSNITLEENKNYVYFYMYDSQNTNLGKNYWKTNYVKGVSVGNLTSVKLYVGGRADYTRNFFGSISQLFILNKQITQNEMIFYFKNLQDILVAYEF